MDASFHRQNLFDRIMAVLSAHAESETWPSRWPTSHLSRKDFEDLALDVVRYQLQANKAYEKFCRHQGIKKPSQLQSPFDAPPVPTDAFKHAQLAAFDPDNAIACFRSSGTTTANRGKHYFRTLDLYRASILPPFRWYMLPDGGSMAMHGAMPKAADAPHSSLAWMLTEVIDTFGDASSTTVVDASGNLDLTGLGESFGRAETSGKPVFLLGPSFAWVHLLDAEPRLRARLPEGSRLFETGGFKGKSRTVSRAELHKELCARLGLNPAMIAGEYGMSELSSQLYETTIRTATLGFSEPGHEDLSARVYLPPPWCAVRVLDPDTLAPLPHGEVGQISMLDLANLDSVAHVITADLGRLVPGEGPSGWHGLPEGVAGLQLLGRAQSATPKGCSIAMDALLIGNEELSP